MTRKTIACEATPNRAPQSVSVGAVSCPGDKTLPSNVARSRRQPCQERGSNGVITAK